LGFSIAEKYFNRKKGGVSTGCPDFHLIQETFETRKRELMSIELDANSRKKTLSIHALKQKSKENKFHSFYSYAEKLVARWKYVKSVNHVKHVESVIRNLKLYECNKDLYFEDFSVSFLRDLEAYYKKANNSNATAKNKLRIIRSIFKEAEKEDLIDFGMNPFLKFSMPKVVINKKEKLDDDELRRITKLKLIEGSPLWHSRNAFMFSFLNAGIRVSDLLQLRWRNIENDRLIYQMMKNKKQSSKVLVSQAKNILSCYKKDSNKPDDFIFPFFKNHFDYSDKYFLDNQISSKTAMYNDNLKKIAHLAGISKKLSSHIARHSFAARAMNQNLSVAEISSLLEHTKLETTENYLPSLKSDAKDKALAKVFEGY
jgi:site-specific recombinase XerD